MDEGGQLSMPIGASSGDQCWIMAGAAKPIRPLHNTAAHWQEQRSNASSKNGHGEVSEDDEGQSADKHYFEDDWYRDIRLDSSPIVIGDDPLSSMARQRLSLSAEESSTSCLSPPPNNSHHNYHSPRGAAPDLINLVKRTNSDTAEIIKSPPISSDSSHLPSFLSKNGNGCVNPDPANMIMMKDLGKNTNSAQRSISLEPLENGEVHWPRERPTVLDTGAIRKKPNHNSSSLKTNNNSKPSRTAVQPESGKTKPGLHLPATTRLKHQKAASLSKVASSSSCRIQPSRIGKDRVFRRF